MFAVETKKNVIILKITLASSTANSRAFCECDRILMAGLVQEIPINTNYDASKCTTGMLNIIRIFYITYYTFCIIFLYNLLYNSV